MDRRWIAPLLALSVFAGCSGAPGGGTESESTRENTSQTSQALTHPVLKNPRIVSVLWGSGVYAAGYLPEFYGDLVTGPYFSLLSSYGIGKGTYAGQVAISPSNKTTALTLSILQNELATDVNLKKLPDTDPNTVYVVQLPEGFTVAAADGSIQCAYHAQFVNHVGVSAFAVVGSHAPGDTCASSEFLHLPFGSQASDTLFTTSHEVIEAVVNPLGGNPEIADPCEFSNNGGIPWTAWMGTNHAWMVQKPYITSSKSCASLPIPAPITPSAANTSSFAVARQAGNLDAFFGELGGNIWNDWWNGSWGRTAATGSEVSPAVPIAATARTGNNLDIFYFNLDAGLSTAFWSAGNTWNELQITDSWIAPTTANVAAVARTPNNLDVFWIGADGALYTAYWSAGNQWNWFRISNTGLAPNGAPLAAVARTKNNLDVFFFDLNGHLQTAYWSTSSGGWGVLDASEFFVAQPNTPITAIARDWSSLDVYWVDPNGNVFTGHWADKQNVASPWNIVFVSPFLGYAGGGAISAVTRQPSNIDLFLVDPNGAVENLFYSDVVGWGKEFATGNGQSAPGSLIAGATRTPNNLDVFETDSSGNNRYDTFWQAGGNWGTAAIP